MKEIALYILDLCFNSIKAEADNLYIEVVSDYENDILKVYIKDDGCGMEEEFVKKVTSPFVTTRKERRVGLGISFFKELTELCDGRFDINSKKGIGTEITGFFKLSHIDLIPIGDMSSTIVSLIMSAPNVDIVFKYKTNKGEFIFDTKKIRKILKDVSLNNVEVLEWIKEFISENMEVLK